MNSILQNIFGKGKTNTQSISVIKYPNRILFETQDQIKNSYSIRTPKVSFLDVNASNFEIGEMIIKHLNLSKYGISQPNDIERKENNEKYKKVTGLKTLKAQMNDSLMVLVMRKNNRIIFTPSVNGGTSGENRGYKHFSKENIEIDDTEYFNLIGESFNQTLKKCL